MEKNLNFGVALVRFKKGDQIARAGWDNEHLVLEGSVIYVTAENGNQTEWTPSHEDLLADDWMVTKEAE